MSEELNENDHRRIGRELNLFHIQEEAAGSVFWHENGWTLFRTIEGYIRRKLKGAGYFEVRTPQLYDRSLWEASGHWDKFGSKNMFSTGDFETVYYNGGEEECVNPSHIIKPMNCPAHVQIFNKSNVSYRQLPMRMAEFGCCHRNEPSGALHGIMRVRQFTQDDAHIFCAEEHVEAETKAFCELLLEVYRDFGFTNVKVGFSTRPEVRAGDDALWDRAEQALENAVKAAGLVYKVQPGEGAFYGPKLEFALTDNKGREWQCGTIQLDFVLPQRLGASFTGADGNRHQPVILHRAILGSIERFIGILLENYEGRLPVWLCPVQAVVLPIRPEHEEYARKVVEEFEGAGVRAVLDARDENLKQRIKEHSLMHVPYMAIVGDREEETDYVTLRSLDGSQIEMHNFSAACAIGEEAHKGYIG